MSYARSRPVEGVRPAVIRGAPRYYRGPAAGSRGVIALVPEVQVGEGGRVIAPLAVVEIAPAGVRRHPIGPPDPGVTLLPVETAPRGHAVRRGPAEAPPIPGVVTTIVPGAPAAADDPRVAAVFGPARPIPGGVAIPLARVVRDPAGAPPSRTAAGAVLIRGGVIQVQGARPARSGALARLRAVLDRLRPGS